MNAASRRGWTRGFTFVELMLGMAITTLVVGAVLGVTSAVSEGWRASEAVQLLQASSVQSSNQINRILRSTNYVAFATADGERAVPSTVTQAPLLASMAAGGSPLGMSASVGGTSLGAAVDASGGTLAADLSASLNGLASIGTSLGISVPLGGATTSTSSTVPAIVSSPGGVATIVCWTDGNGDQELQASEIELLQRDPATSTLRLYSIPVSAQNGSVVFKARDIADSAAAEQFKALPNVTSRVVANDVGAASFRAYCTASTLQRQLVEYGLKFRRDRQERTDYGTVCLRAAMIPKDMQ